MQLNTKPCIRLLAIFLAVWLLLPVTSNAAESEQDENRGTTPGSYRTELAIGSGYMWGSLKETNDGLTAIPAFVRIGFNMNPLFGIKGNSSSLQFTVEPFVNTIMDPETGVETGCGLGLRYLHTLNRSIEIYTETGIAPMYLSIDTLEQGHSGFNFLTHAGAGLQYRVSPDMAIFTGYRFRHLSHGNIADRANAGIESSAIVAGVAWYY